MKLLTYNEPFKFSEISNLITLDENVELYSVLDFICNDYTSSINDFSFFKINDDLQNNVGIPYQSTKYNQFIFSILKKIKNRLSSRIVTNDYPVLYNNGDVRSWHLGVNLTSDLKDKPLLPHTDNPDEIYEWSKANNITTNAGLYKGVLYIGNSSLNYDNYGTVMYSSKKITDVIKEIPFIPGNACIFETSPNSYHGTNFKNGLPHRRYTITMEYY